jgi:hypothetical protein
MSDYWVSLLKESNLSRSKAYPRQTERDARKALCGRLTNRTPQVAPRLVFKTTPGPAELTLRTMLQLTKTSGLEVYWWAGKDLHLHSVRGGFTGRWAHSCPARPECNDNDA